MIKKTVTYQDFDGKSQTEDLYFHLTKPDTLLYATKMRTVLGLPEERMDNTKSEEELAAEIKDALNRATAQNVLQLIDSVIDMAYGVKSDDAKHFHKSAELLADFKSSLAYEELFSEFIRDGQQFQSFVEGLIGAAPPTLQLA